MTSSSEEQPVLEAAARPLARLGASHGYRLEGDSVHLRATLADVKPAARHVNWALQLWACPVGSSDPLSPGAHQMAEAWLPPLEELTETGIEVVAEAVPPAGTAEWTMCLALVAARGERFDEVHDLSAYARAEHFRLPQLRGEVLHRMVHDHVRLTVETVANPRIATNVSGTLSLELWALPTPYSGGWFEGESIAGAVLGPLHGQTQWHALSFDLPYVAPPAGTWYPVIMLREWIGDGYVTRDFRSDATPLVIAAARPIAKKAVDGSPLSRRKASV